MYKDVLRSIEGIGWLPSLALVLFLGVFVGVVVMLLFKDRNYWQKFAEIPVEDEVVTKRDQNGNQSEH